jgi:ADP-heptose:LPS heptosyltransferase/GT2 family glycosyltransferase
MSAGWQRSADGAGTLMEALFSDYEEIRKSGLFDAEYYLASYRDVAERNVDPLLHYLEEGGIEGRNPHPEFDAAFYLEQCRHRGETPNNPLLHYLRIGKARGFALQRGQASRSSVAAPSGAVAAKPPIIVAVEALGVLGAADGTTRVSLSGWALATAPIGEITAALDGETIGTAAYGLARPDVAQLYPDRPAAANSGFILAFDLPGRDTAGQTTLTVRTEDGEIGHHQLHFTVPPQKLAAPTLDPLDPAGAVAEPGPIQLGIDEVAVAPDGLLRVAGWAVCRAQLETIDVLLDGRRIGAAAFGRVRADIEAAYPNYPNARFSGFDFVAAIAPDAPGHKIVTVAAKARDGIATEAAAEVAIPRLPAARAEVGDSGFHHHVDDIILTTSGRLALKGWVVAPSRPTAVAVLLDGIAIGTAKLGVERPEIGNLFPALPHSRQSGFAFTAPVARPSAGGHSVTLQMSCEDGRTREAAVAVVASEHDRFSRTRDDPDRKLHLDAPLLIGGAAATPVRGNLQVAGWALARAGVAAIEIRLDGRPVALADYGLRRLDVQAALPDWEGALASGWQAIVPHRLLDKGGHTVTVTLRDAEGGALTSEFRIEVEELADRPGPWSLRRKMAQAEIDLQLRLVACHDPPPRFVIVLPLAGNAAGHRAGVTLASLCAQAYPHWRLIVVASGRGVRDKLAAVPPGRIEIVRRLAPAMLADDAYCVLLTSGDELGIDALLEMALAAATQPDADFLYSDERRRNPASGAVAAFFKPQWSPDLLLSTNYIGRLWCVRVGLLRAVAADDEALLGHGEYDLVLRCTEAAKAIRHVPAVLCERAADGWDDDAGEERRALQRALARRGIKGDVEAGAAAGHWQVRRALTRPGLVSIVIPTCAAGGLIETCLETLQRLTHYRNYEIVCIENIAARDRQWRTWLRRHADRVIRTREPFNWARFSNLAAAEAKGDYLLFMNDDIEIIDPNWLDALVAEAQRPEVGVVGPLLLYPDRRVQHAGMFLAAVGQARHAFRYAAEDDPGYFGLARTTRNVVAVTGACLMTRRDTYDALGGFDETQSIVNNDLDYALRARQRGLLTVYTPHARLIHHESISRAALDDDYDAAVFDSKWRDLFLAGDPYFNPHLSKHHDDFAADDEPTQLLVTGRPTIRRDDIKKILVVKLDHIGDCIIAFPAIRRLKALFPAAQMTVLTSRASRPVWSLEPSVGATIEFDFFHARSGLGELERSEEDWRELRARLLPHAFDLAVDLRKHTETRPVLEHTGARLLAGFDFRNQFPWLDVALEWTGDQVYVRKRQHNGDDLVNLVDAIGAACEKDRCVIAPPPAVRPAKRTATGPLVCVHPTVGNDARQWPVEYFSAVIDRLVEADAARVVLIGAPGDEEVAAAILKQLRRPEGVTSLVGKLPLAELPALLAGASLFLGNNSGPKHIAAGLGVPTVGVHSGTEDVREWGPVGPAAIAVARDMVCAPCYLAYAADCRRGLACLKEIEPSRVYEACKRLLLLNGRAAPAQQSRAGTEPAGAALTGHDRRRRTPGGDDRAPPRARGGEAPHRGRPRRDPR